MLNGKLIPNIDGRKWKGILIKIYLNTAGVYSALDSWWG